MSLFLYIVQKVRPLNSFERPVRVNNDFDGLEFMQDTRYVIPDTDNILDMEGLDNMRAPVVIMPDENAVINNDFVLVDRDYLPMVKVNMLRDWVGTKNGLTEATEDVLDEKIKLLQIEKADVRRLAREYIHVFFVEALKIKGYSTIKTQDDIKKFWFNNKETEAGINLMKYVLYGHFDERKNCELALESKIIKIKKVKYREIDGEKETKG